ncbi:MAG: glutaminase [Mycobacterium sp.]
MAGDALNPRRLQEAVTHGYDAHRRNAHGHNAAYIPALASVDPDLFAVCAMTPDGEMFTTGDIDHEFPIESWIESTSCSYKLGAHMTVPSCISLTGSIRPATAAYNRSNVAGR